MNRFNRRLIYLSSIVLLLSIAGSYLLFIQQSKEATKELVDYWHQSSKKQIQEGNLLSTITTNHRSVMFSDFISGVSIFDTETNSSLVEIGESKDLENYYVTNIETLKVTQTGLFNFAYFIKPSESSSLVVGFLIRPKSYIVLFYIFTGTSITLLALFILLIRMSHTREVKNREQIIFTSVKTLFDRKEPSQILSHLAPDLVRSWNKIDSEFTRLLSNETELVRYKEKIKTSRKIAHDIRSPLSALNLASQSFEKNPKAASQLIKTAAQRINNIAEDLLKKERGEPDTPTHHPEKDDIAKQNYQASNSLKNAAVKSESVNLKTSLSELIQELSYIARDKELDFNADVQSDLSVEIPDYINKELLRSLSNLITNSFEATQAEGKVHFKVLANERDRWIQFNLSDRGQGMPSHILKQALAGGYTNKENGNGLGLSSAVEFFRSSGGFLDIKSRENMGTTIFARLPMDFENPISRQAKVLKVAEDRHSPNLQ